MADPETVNPVVEAEEGGATAPKADDASKEPEKKGCVGETKEKVTTWMDSKWGACSAVPWAGFSISAAVHLARSLWLHT